jgi:hypothetical protein
MKLKWENEGGQWYSESSAPSCYGFAPVWHIYMNPDKFDIHGSHTSLLKHISGGTRFDCICKAKAACQTAEDKLCDVWPKYYDGNSGGGYFTLYIDGRLTWTTSDGDTHTETTDIYPITDMGKTYRAITEEEALSRITKEEVMTDKKLVIDVMQIENVLVVKFVHVDRAIARCGVSFQHGLFSITGASLPLLTSEGCGKLHFPNGDRYLGRTCVSCTYSCHSDAKRDLRLLRNAVTALNEKYSDKPSQTLPEPEQGWERCK